MIFRQYIKVFVTNRALQTMRIQHNNDSHLEWLCANIRLHIPFINEQLRLFALQIDPIQNI